MPIITIDSHHMQVFIDNEPLMLTKKEYDVFLLLFQNQGKICTRRYIYETIWGADHYATENVIERIILQLRQKLSKINAESKILTRRGFGYLFMS